MCDCSNYCFQSLFNIKSTRLPAKPHHPQHRYVHLLWCLVKFQPYTQHYSSIQTGVGTFLQEDSQNPRFFALFVKIFLLTLQFVFIMDSYTGLNYSHYSTEALMYTQKSPESDRAGRARTGSMPSTHLQSLFVGMREWTHDPVDLVVQFWDSAQILSWSAALKMSFSLIMSQRRYTYISLCSVGLLGFF